MVTLSQYVRANKKSIHYNSRNRHLLDVKYNGSVDEFWKDKRQRLEVVCCEQGVVADIGFDDAFEMLEGGPE